MRILVVGGNAAGLSAASKARRTAADVEILVLERGRDISYAQCGLPYLLSGMVADEAALVHFTPAGIMRERGIEVRTGHHVTALRLSEHQVLGERTNGTPFAEPYDRLILATGARPRVPPALSRPASNVFTLHTYQDLRRLRVFLAAQKPPRVTIVGASYLGLEMAEAFRTLGLAVTVLEAAPQPLPGFDSPLASLAADELARNNVHLMLERPASALDIDGGGICRAVVGDWGSQHCDAVLLALGVRPNVELAEQAHLRLGPTGAIPTDRRLATERPGVFACGDCAETVHLVTGKPTWVPLGSTANKQGRVAGANAVGGDESFPGVVGTAGLRLFNLEMARTGLSLREAQASGFEAAVVTITAPSRAAYMRGASEITISLVVESATRRILGAHAAGKEGVAKRVDLFAVAAAQGLTADDVAGWDLSYAPPFAPVWDPVLVAANVARRR
jgi:NADPH-dependent 2,4-dienoyl-CoA reductase/sulfur reductase-like enzyme